MKKNLISLIVAFGLCASPAAAQTAKELKTKKGASVALVNLLNVRPGCTSIPAPVTVPIVHEKPANGTVQMLIVAVELAASAGCAARKVPTVTLIYTPNADFTGADSVGIEIETGNRTTSLSYHVTVLPPGDSL
jgi:hypothetical protein